jgi:cytochrome c biogenesis protein CcdA
MLVAILSIAASSGSLMRGGMLLFGYSLGQSVFVILAGLFTSAFMGFLENEKGVLVVEVARKLSGIIIAGFGGYLLIRPYI